MNSLPKVGFPCKGPNLTFVRDLEAFDGPILSELKDEEDCPWIEKWCSRQEGIVRTLLVRSSRQAIDAYLAGNITMMNLLMSGYGSGIVADFDISEGSQTFQAVEVHSLPEKYLPGPMVLHDPSLFPES